jgi:glycyl-tRNA synthetase beta chain
MSHSAPLLIELFTEELPPKSLQKLSEAFSQQLIHKLIALGLVAEKPIYKSFATPRRLAVLIQSVFSKAPDTTVQEKLLPVAIALSADGQPTAPLIKKLNQLGISDISLAKLEKKGEGKNEAFYVELQKTGYELHQGLQEAIDFSISQLPIAKTMHYQINPNTPQEVDVQFVRPVHSLIAVHGSTIVPISVLGLSASNTTLGHRFLSSGLIKIAHADAYEEKLLAAKVIADSHKRLESIKNQLLSNAGSNIVLMPQTLLEEVNALVEWPTVYACAFEEEFLDVPQECLILTMQTNQKYFAMTDSHSKLINRFLIVSNMETKSPESIISGNERVVRPRLSDAKFFFQQDQKIPLIDRFEDLSKVVYHNKLGSQKERVNRIIQIAEYISQALSQQLSDTNDISQKYANLTSRAGMLMKADLLTDMVGEFPELQGVMGRYYALHDKENQEVAAACEEHYLPRFSGDRLPQTRVGLILALAEKIETIVGIWGIGLAPTGEKDPYALRRHALGVCRLIIENDLRVDLKDLIDSALDLFNHAPAQKATLESDIFSFIKERLKSYVKDFQGVVFSTEEIESVISLVTGQMNEVPKKLLAVHEFQKLPQAAVLANANKRLNNILKKNSVDNVGDVNPQLLDLDAEKNLFATLSDLEPVLMEAFDLQNFQLSLELLTKMSGPIENFFTDVMVMDPDPLKRQNRLALLSKLYRLMNQVADISLLAK